MSHNQYLFITRISITEDSNIKHQIFSNYVAHGPPSVLEEMFELHENAILNEEKILIQAGVLKNKHFKIIF